VGHYGGIIRNNFILQKRNELRVSEKGFDSGISLDQACGAKVIHNTVVSTDAPFSSIEWRFPNTNAEIMNNLVSHNLKLRDSGNAVLAGNHENTLLSYFTDLNVGNLHLSETASEAVDKGIVLADTALCADDIDEDKRDSSPDIGADEYKKISFSAGDIDGIKGIDIKDAILALQVAAGMNPAVNLAGDVNNDNKTGLHEAIYVLQKISGLR